MAFLFHVRADMEWQCLQPLPVLQNQQIVAAFIIPPTSHRLIYNLYIHLHPFCDIQWRPALH